MPLKKQGKKQIFFFQILKNRIKIKTSIKYISTHICSSFLNYPDKSKNNLWFSLQLKINVLYLFTNNINKMTPEAERFNGWAAMLGFVAAVGAYVTTGQIIPGWF